MMPKLKSALTRLNAALDALDRCAPAKAAAGEFERLREDRRLLTEELDAARADCRRWRALADGASAELDVAIADLRAGAN